MKPMILIWLSALLWLNAAGCRDGAMKNSRPGTEERVQNGTAAGAQIALPPPQQKGKVTVEEAMYARVSRRSYGTGGLSLFQVGQLLWAAGGLGVDGITGASRTVPSAGATYPLEYYLVAGEVANLPAGIFRYNYHNHTLEALRPGDKRAELARAALGQEMVAQAPASIVMLAHYERTTARYGDRGLRYVYMEAGYASQNIYLQAEALNLATVAVGAFDDRAVAEIMAAGGAPLMIMPVGLSAP